MMSDPKCWALYDSGHEGAWTEPDHYSAPSAWAEARRTTPEERVIAAEARASQGEPTPATPDLTPVQRAIAEECDRLKALLIEKNRAYGNSALDPVRVFSKASPEEQILVRIDDKLSRLARGSAAGEDVVQDLLGYLILLRVARRGL